MHFILTTFLNAIDVEPYTGQKRSKTQDNAPRLDHSEKIKQPPLYAQESSSASVPLIFKNRPLYYDDIHDCPNIYPSDAEWNEYCKNYPVEALTSDNDSDGENRWEEHSWLLDHHA